MFQLDFIYLLKNTATLSLAFRFSAEEEGAYMVEDLVTHSPEPQEPMEAEASVQPEEGSPFDRLHPEQNLSHIFKVFFFFFFFNFSLDQNFPCGFVRRVLEPILAAQRRRQAAPPDEELFTGT